MGKRKEGGETPKSSKKSKKADDDEDEAVPPGVKTYEERLQALSPISTPLADEKLTKKLHKLVKKASAGKVRATCGARPRVARARVPRARNRRLCGAASRRSSRPSARVPRASVSSPVRRCE